MRVRTFLLLLLLLAIALFAAVNWAAFTEPTTLSLLVATVQAPLGIIMLALVVALTVVFVLFGAWLQTTALLETRAHSRELAAQRKLADEAEASRITAMQQAMTAELASLREQTEASHAAILSRLEQAEAALHAVMDQNANTVAACFGELEDRLERGAAPPLKRLGP